MDIIQKYNHKTMQKGVDKVKFLWNYWSKNE